MVAPHLNYLRHVKNATVIPASAMPERLHRVLAENMATQSQHGRGALNLEGTLCPNPIFVCRGAFNNLCEQCDLPDGCGEGTNVGSQHCTL